MGNNYEFNADCDAKQLNIGTICVIRKHMIALYNLYPPVEDKFNFDLPGV